MINLRIISGKYKGKIIKEYNILGTRPTMDRIKESLFAMIQSYIPESICLDLFCGSGSLGIEALSNGAKECYFIDKNKKITEILKNNTKDIDNVFIINNDFQTFLKNTKVKFDIIFLDPPYDLFLINDAIKLIEQNNILNKNGLIICEYTKENIKSNPYIEDVKITRNLDGIVIVDVTERIPTFSIKGEEEYFYINNQGYILEKTSSTDILPIIYGYSTTDVDVGQRLCKEDLKKLDSLIRNNEHSKKL